MTDLDPTENSMRFLDLHTLEHPMEEKCRIIDWIRLNNVWFPVQKSVRDLIGNPYSLFNGNMDPDQVINSVEDPNLGTDSERDPDPDYNMIRLFQADLDPNTHLDPHTLEYPMGEKSR